MRIHELDPAVAPAPTGTAAIAEIATSWLVALAFLAALALL